MQYIGKEESFIQSFCGENSGNETFGRCGHNIGIGRWEHNIGIDLKKIDLGGRGGRGIN
jgi:hypothetical protein